MGLASGSGKRLLRLLRLARSRRVVGLSPTTAITIIIGTKGGRLIEYIVKIDHFLDQRDKCVEVIVVNCLDSSNQTSMQGRCIQ